MVEPTVYLEKLSAFSRLLRLKGLNVGPRETADAAQVLIHLGMAQRETVKTALRTVYSSSREEQLQFNAVFDGFFLSEEKIRQQAQEQRQSRAQQEFMEFHQRFPDVKIQDIPQDVIRKSASGEMSLAGAYQVHLYDQLKAENQRLQQTIDARKQNEENRQKSLGSARSAGSGEKEDPFLSGFAEG